MAFTDVTLTGTVELQPGTPAVGAVVTLQLSSEITDGTTIIEPVAQTARCDTTGSFTMTVPANDDSTTIPTGTSYVVTLSLGTTVIDSFGVIVPHADAPTVDLFSLARLGSSPAASTPYVVSLAGLNGVVTLTSSDHSITIRVTGSNIDLTVA